MKNHKKVLSSLLALTMLGAMALPTFADEPPAPGGNWQQGTQVTYTGTAQETYTVTVPATMAPGSTENVKAEGTWASNRKLTVSADESVTLTNSINEANKKTLDVTFDGIDEVGDNTKAIEVTETISVAEIQNALFGTWSGLINYSVAMNDNADASPNAVYNNGSDTLLNNSVAE